MEVPAGAYSVGWSDRSPTPGQLGPSVLAGHVDWEGEPGAFYGLRELRPGDTVVVDRADGIVATYEVDRVEQHAKADFPTDAVYGDRARGLAAHHVRRCLGWGHGDYSEKVTVFARLTAIG